MHLKSRNRLAPVVEAVAVLEVVVAAERPVVEVSQEVALVDEAAHEAVSEAVVAVVVAVAEVSHAVEDVVALVEEEEVIERVALNKPIRSRTPRTFMFICGTGASRAVIDT